MEYMEQQRIGIQRIKKRRISRPSCVENSAREGREDLENKESRKEGSISHKDNEVRLPEKKKTRVSRSFWDIEYINLETRLSVAEGVITDLKETINSLQKIIYENKSRLENIRIEYGPHL